MGYTTDTGDELGDIFTAVVAVEALNTPDDPAVIERNVRISDESGSREDVLTGVGSLIRIFMANLTTIYQQSHADEDAIHRAVPAVVTRLRNTPEISDEVIPTMAGALTAAAMDQNPNLWRDRYGPMPDGELLPWTYTAAYLASLVDLHTGIPGSATKVVREFCATMVPDDVAEYYFGITKPHAN